jgi:hypothetical protein
MRRFVLLLPAFLAACATSEGEPPIYGTPAAVSGSPIHGDTPGHACNATGTDRFLGRKGNSSTGTAIKYATHSKVFRWAPPGYAMTMDFRADRVTVTLDESYKIIKINCG